MRYNWKKELKYLSFIFQQKPSDFPLCIIVALDDMWPPKQIAIETYKNLRPVSKGKTSPRNACELGSLFIGMKFEKSHNC